MPSPRRRPLVLLVEDNQTQLDLYEVVLEREFSVMHTTRGGDAVRLASEHLPDAIVMDVMLPDLDGLEATDRIHADPMTSKIPIVVLTGSDEAYARAHRQLDELTGVLMKPCPGDRLVDSLQQAIQRARATV